MFHAAQRTSLFALALAAAAVVAPGIARTLPGAAATPPEPTPLALRLDERTGTLTVHRQGEERALLTQNARPGFRPYLHPIETPDGRGAFTEFSPGHHRHQTGLYWGFTRLNGRDYFHNPDSTHWRRVSIDAVEASGETVVWQTVYDLLDEAGQPVLRETQIWSMREEDGRYLLDLEWRGEARADVTVAQYDYGGLFLRMPWREGMEAGIVNAARQRDQAAEGKRAMWVDVGMRVEGRDDQAHVALFDHPD
ncbi:MAG TPA: DUF6807 family protein, partial [Longimicrobiaceae bacterium]